MMMYYTDSDSDAMYPFSSKNVSEYQGSFNPPNIRTAEKFGLSITKIAWEDTGRTKNSAFGPNISDMTLNMNNRPQPMIRKPNFADLTSDKSFDDFTVNVGNEVGAELKTISLREYLENITKYTDAKVIGSLINNEDQSVLVSAQSCVLSDSAEFDVCLYNYQSYNQPMVLVVIASAQGTSAHFVVSRSNSLKFNKNKKVASFIAERLKDDRAKRGVDKEGAMTDDEKVRNALMIFQIPLERQYTVQERRAFAAAACAAVSYKGTSRGYSDGCTRSCEGMDHAVIHTSEGRGEYPSLNHYAIKRDFNLPIRCTIQYYHITDSAEITENEMKQISEEVTRHKPIGSLVVGGKTERPTEPKIDVTVPTIQKQERFGMSRLFTFL